MSQECPHSSRHRRALKPSDTALGGGARRGLTQKMWAHKEIWAHTENLGSHRRWPTEVVRCGQQMMIQEMRCENASSLLHWCCNTASLDPSHWFLTKSTLPSVYALNVCPHLRACGYSPTRCRAASTGCRPPCFGSHSFSTAHPGMTSIWSIAVVL